MKRKEPRCPKCGLTNVTKDLKCENCDLQLVYADTDGSLKPEEKERRCPRCETVNSKDVKHCENCGFQIGKWCGYCKSYHFVEDKVCPRTSEPIKDPEKAFSGPALLPKALVALSILAMLIFGGAMYKTARNPGPQPTTVVVSPSPVYINGNQGLRKPRIDVVFVVDATGSMGDEIEVVKTKIKDMLSIISSGQPKPHVRYGLVAYRDRGDAFVTMRYDLTDSIDEITRDINQLHADGGGDTPEAVGTALDVAINQIGWDESSNTRKLIFLIGDAGPHLDALDIDYKTPMYQAREKGIKINAIGCSGIDTNGEGEFREIAMTTGGEFDFLTYQQVIRQRDGSEVKVMKAGDKSFVVTDGAKDDWREGYKTMVTSKKAEVVEEDRLETITSAPGAMPSEIKNNLDSMLTRQVQMEARKMGVKYKE
ncbi:MAG: VWA domain-containing protein [Vulcanimicrobiota bacterium]